MSKPMSVQVKKCQLRNKPTFLAKIVTNLQYGDIVEVEREKQSWAEVKTGNKPTGWVHVSALSEKKIILKPNSQDIKNAASGDEIALAGKGFNEQVEENYKKNNKNIDFAWVDKMEQFVVTQEEMISFLQQGGLKSEGENNG